MRIEYLAGKYLCDVEEQAWTRAKTGSRMLILTIKPKAQLVTRGDGKGGMVTEQVPTKNSYPRKVRVVVTKTTAEMALKKLRAAGFKGNKWSEVDLLGYEVACDCTEETYEGKPVERWDLSLGGEALVSQPEVADELDVEMPIAAVVTSAPNTSPGSTAVGMAPEDEDIPFAVFLPLLLPLLHLIHFAA